jgi:hypothetical protein
MRGKRELKVRMGAQGQKPVVDCASFGPAHFAQPRVRSAVHLPVVGLQRIVTPRTQPVGDILV